MATNLNFNIGPYVVPLLVLALVARRLIKNKPRKVKPNRLFILPAIVTFGTAFTFYGSGWPGAWWLLVYMLAALAGARWAISPRATANSRSTRTTRS